MTDLRYLEVEWWCGDLETGRWRDCDVCFETYLDDVWAVPQREIRRFYLDFHDRITICENCMIGVVKDG